MTTLRSFYQSSHWFWVISRILIVLLFLVSLLQIMAEGGMRHTDALLVNAVCMVGVVLFGILAVIELVRGPKPTWLRISAGSLLLLFGVGLLVLFAIGPVTGGLGGLLLFVTAWFLLLGLRDLVMS